MKSELLLNEILKNLAEGLIVVDHEANILFFNEPATNLAGITQAEAIGKNILDVFKELTAETSTFFQVLKTGKPIVDYVQSYTNYQGRLVTTITSTLPLYEEGHMIGAFEIYRESSALFHLTEQMEKLLKAQRQERMTVDQGDKLLLGISESIRNLRKRIGIIADSPSPVFIYGETGVGKELVVQMIHGQSQKRSKKPLIAQNCAAIPNTLLESILFGTTIGSFTGARNSPGLFELANGGVLYLDEINSMDLELQAKLLRVLQDQEIRRIGAATTVVVDARIVASTNEDPEILVETGRLREDLYYRLKVIPVYIPPLRERTVDIPIMVNAFVHEFNHKLSRQVLKVENGLMETLISRPWKGNVRELKYMIEGMMNFVEGDILGLEHFPSVNPRLSVGGTAIKDKTDFNKEVEHLEIKMIREALDAEGCHLTKAALRLQLPKQTLFNKMKKYKIDIVKKI